MQPDPSTRCAHACDARKPGEPSAPPIALASYHVSSGDPAGAPYAYGRHGNETWDALEHVLGDLDGGKALVFASGQAAALAALMVLTETRPRVVVPHDGYYGVRKLGQMLAPRGVEIAPIDFGDAGAIEHALNGRASVLWAETPTNPFLRVFPLRELAAIARAAGSPWIVDNTTATAALQRPLDFGADIVLTSLTKSTSGHSDVVLGALSTARVELHEQLRNWRANAGLIAGPFEAWLALRGIKTLPLRIARQSENARALAEHLASHPKVVRVHYPSLDPATRRMAELQMRGGFGPLLSFELRGDATAADRAVDAAQLIRAATSFGGVETTWERRARWASETAPASLIRVSVGIESISDLVGDVDRALGAA